jgi:hypothetical protein
MDNRGEHRVALQGDPPTGADTGELRAGEHAGKVPRASAGDQPSHDRLSSAKGPGHQPLRLADRDLRVYPYWARREHLERLLRGARPPLALRPATLELDGGRAWMTEHVAAGIEGVVIKDVRHGYRPGRRTWTKVRTRTTADAVVGGVLGPLDARTRNHRPKSR